MIKKLLAVVFSILLISGCTQKPQEPVTPVEPAQALSILAPNGAPALSLLEYNNEFGTDSLTLVDGADVLSAALINPTPEYDVIVAPINLGATLINKGSSYRLLGVVTWGNLYLVVNDAQKDSDLPIALFGEGAVPGKVVNSALDLTALNKEIVYYNSVADVQVALLTGKASYGLLAEPALTATTAKAKEADITLSVVYDVQEEYNKANNTTGYPQAAVFVQADRYAEKANDYAELVAKLTALNQESVTLLTDNEAFYGVPSVAVVQKAWAGMRVEYRPAADVKTEIAAFLKLFGIESIDNLFLE